MDPEKLKEITATANEAVKDLEPNLKEAAFKTILEKLLDAHLDTTSSKKKSAPAKKKPGKSSSKSVKHAEPDEYDNITNKLMEGINRTKYPAIYNMKVSKDRALYLLKIARDDLNIDGLMPPQIAEVLVKNFRLKSTGAAISMALMNSVNFVDRKQVSIRGGRGYVYQLMHEGEKYLESKLSEKKEKGSG